MMRRSGVSRRVTLSNTARETPRRAAIRPQPFEAVVEPRGIGADRRRAMRDRRRHRLPLQDGARGRLGGRNGAGGLRARRRRRPPRSKAMATKNAVFSAGEPRAPAILCPRGPMGAADMVSVR